MKAIGLWGFGGPEVLVPVELPLPVPGAGEVRVRVHGAAVNPTDVTFRSGGRAAQLEGRPLPFVPGTDFSGVVDELGPGADGRLGIGDAVVGLLMPFGPHGGAYAEHVVVDARSVTAAPAGQHLLAASTLLLNAVTASLALDAIDAPSGSAVAVSGAAGAVGGFAVQLARHRGLRVIADAAEADRELVEALGARSIVARGDGFAAAVRAQQPTGVAGVIDTAGLVDAALPAIVDGGVVVELKGQQPALERGVRLAAISSFGSVTDLPLLTRLSGLAADGVLGLRVADVLPAAQAPAAHRRLAEGGLRGRLVLDMTSFDHDPDLQEDA